MKKTTTLLALVSVLAIAGCTTTDSYTETRAKSLHSCFDTGFGMKCVDTPDGLVTVAMDVNNDGIDDEFVCGDAASASDSDSLADDSDESSVDDGTESDESGDADSESDSDSDSESDEDCGPSISDGDSLSSSESDADGDGDGDRITDSIDCDCI